MPEKSQHKVSILLDGRCCLARESGLGYRNVLNSLGYQMEMAAEAGMLGSRVIIIPAGEVLSRSKALQLREKAEEGHWLILESGLGFAVAHEAENQRTVLRHAFGLHTEVPDNLSTARLSYMRYRWPVDVSVRHFSPVVSIRGRNHRTIAELRGLTVGAMKRIGYGGMVFLGSPLGPMLLAQDREATLLLRQIMAECHQVV